VSAAIYEKFQALAAKRRQEWPIAYLTGHKEFYGLDFLVSPAVLVPRPETELLVEEILAAVEKTNGDAVARDGRAERQPGAGLIVDVGTGSGAVIISAAAELKRLASDIYKKTAFAAVDISPTALLVAKKNAARQGLGGKIRFYRGDLLAPLRLDKSQPRGRLIIAANLPYLTPAQIKGSPSIKREPRLALDGGPDGLKYYKRLFEQLARLDGSGTDIMILCEINPGQKAAGTRLAKKYFPDAEIEVKKDLAKKYRLLEIRRPN